MWRHQAVHLVEFLIWTAHAKTGQLPPPRKRLFSPSLLAMLPGGTALLGILEEIRHATTADKDTVLAVYRCLAMCEDAILDTADLSAGMWWRGVFTERIAHLARHNDRPDLAALAQAAPKPGTTL